MISGSNNDAWNGAPRYTVTGTASGAQFSWTLSDGQSGSSSRSPFQVAPAAPAQDGAYTLTVRQTTFLFVTEQAQRTFVMDRQPPAALVLSGPGHPVIAGSPATFAWTGVEARARVTWRVRDAAGAVVEGPVTTTENRVAIDDLPAGEYRFSALQTDAAGNAGPEAAVPLSIVTASLPAPDQPPGTGDPLSPGPQRPSRPTTSGAAIPTLRPNWLRPRVATTLKTRRPILSWRRWPRATQMYNVQIFRIVGPLTVPDGRVKVRKVHGSFPRITRMRSPRLRPGSCYVWRVWPYLRGGYSKGPLAISNFCVRAATRP
ncbi:MAG: hypothetical protein AB7V42_03855 [Thermoleophilia bacterium]